eukprot:scaffold111747_cov32-Prasinocladus_malaysianus.AAC.1
MFQDSHLPAEVASCQNQLIPGVLPWPPSLLLSWRAALRIARSFRGVVLLADSLSPAHCSRPHVLLNGLGGGQAGPDLALAFHLADEVRPDLLRTACEGRPAVLAAVHSAMLGPLGDPHVFLLLVLRREVLRRLGHGPGRPEGFRHGCLCKTLGSLGGGRRCGSAREILCGAESKRPARNRSVTAVASF